MCIGAIVVTAYSHHHFRRGHGSPTGARREHYGQLPAVLFALDHQLQHRSTFCLCFHLFVLFLLSSVASCLTTVEQKDRMQNAIQDILAGKDPEPALKVSSNVGHCYHFFILWLGAIRLCSV